MSDSLEQLKKQADDFFDEVLTQMKADNVSLPPKEEVDRHYAEQERKNVPLPSKDWIDGYYVGPAGSETRPGLSIHLTGPSTPPSRGALGPSSSRRTAHMPGESTPTSRKRTAMSQHFDEAKIRRAGDGKFTTKGFSEADGGTEADLGNVIVTPAFDAADARQCIQDWESAREGDDGDKEFSATYAMAEALEPLRGTNDESDSALDDRHVSIGGDGDEGDQYSAAQWVSEAPTAHLDRADEPADATPTDTGAGLNPEHPAWEPRWSPDDEYEMDRAVSIADNQRREDLIEGDVREVVAGDGGVWSRAEDGDSWVNVDDPDLGPFTLQEIEQESGPCQQTEADAERAETITKAQEHGVEFATQGIWKATSGQKADNDYTKADDDPFYQQDRGYADAARVMALRLAHPKATPAELMEMAAASGRAIEQAPSYEAPYGKAKAGFAAARAAVGNPQVTAADLEEGAKDAVRRFYETKWDKNSPRDKGSQQATAEGIAVMLNPRLSEKERIKAGRGVLVMLQLSRGVSDAYDSVRAAAGAPPAR